MQLRNLKIGIRAASVFALLGILVLFMGLSHSTKPGRWTRPPTKSG
jgi:hypothetical protein